MTALSKFLVFLAIFLLERSGDALMNLSSAAGSLVQVNHLIWFDESMSNPTNELKWEPHARMGIYVGCSTSHAANVSLMLNPWTGHVSPQFHVVYNNDFTMAPCLCNATVPPHWVEIVKSSSMINSTLSNKLEHGKRSLNLMRRLETLHLTPLLHLTLHVIWRDKSKLAPQKI